MHKVAVTIVEKLQKQGYLAYFAGGWVRDFLLGVDAEDVDIVTSATIEEIEKLFVKTIPVGVQFGIIVVIEEGFSFELASFRSDGKYIDGRHPSSIHKASPEEDAKRRDFTINGLFFDPIEKKIYDYVGGEKDLACKIVRAIGKAEERFCEDKLRMIRAVRYAERFGFTIEEKTYAAILKYAKELFPAVSIERVWVEVKKMGKNGTLASCFPLLYKLQLLASLLDFLHVSLDKRQMEKALEDMQKLSKESDPLCFLWLLVGRNRTLREWEEMCEKMKMSCKEKEFALFLHHSLKMLENYATLSAVDGVYFYANLRAEEVIGVKKALLPLQEREVFHLWGEKTKQDLLPFIEKRKAKESWITGADLLKENLSPGPHLGLLLKEAEKIAIEQKICSKEELMDQLKKSALWP